MKTILLKKFFLLKKSTIELFHRRLEGQIALPKSCRLDERVPYKNLFSKKLCSKLYRMELNGSIVWCTSIIIVYSVKIAKLFSRCLCFAYQIDTSWLCPLVISSTYERKERKLMRKTILRSNKKRTRDDIEIKQEKNKGKT